MEGKIGAGITIAVTQQNDIDRVKEMVAYTN